MFIIICSGGRYTDAYSNNMGVVSTEEKAIAYCEKSNAETLAYHNTLDKIRDFYAAWAPVNKCELPEQEIKLRGIDHIKKVDRTPEMMEVHNKIVQHNKEVREKNQRIRDEFDAKWAEALQQFLNELGVKTDNIDPRTTGYYASDLIGTYSYESIGMLD